MKLSGKTFLYSMMLAVIMVAFVAGYFVLMLPSLYVDYVMKQNRNAAVEIQRAYAEKRSYDDIAVKNPSAVYSIEIPDEGATLYLAGKFFKLTMEIKDEELLNLLDKARNAFLEIAESEETKEETEFWAEGGAQFWEILQEKFVPEALFAKNAPVFVRIETKNGQGIYYEEYDKVHMISDNLILYEAGASDGSSSYTNYMAMSHAEDAFIITVLPTVTPQMDEITPVVMRSLPMIAAVVFLLILISSRFFSGKIVNPVIRLAGYAESARLAKHFEVEPFGAEGDDEIAALGRTIQKLYEEIRDNYLELEQKNRALEEENTRQEVFLRASAHQLKTPVSAALLLVEGMTDGIGKYKDTRKYLPEVKRQLMSMKKIVEDILYLNRRAAQMEPEETELEALAKELAGAYKVQMESRGLWLDMKGRGVVMADREILKKIMDNLFSNAVQYTPEGERIEIEIRRGEFCIKNYGAVIEEELVPNIFDPFVSGRGGGGSGLGLYVAAYYSRLLGCGLTVENTGDGVRAVLRFEPV